MTDREKAQLLGLSFSKRLRRLRELQPTIRSMVRTSELMGLPSDALRRYERGEAEPSLASLGKIADYYDVTVDFLLGRPEGV